MKKIVLLATAMVCCLLRLGFAATLNVPADYPTIQAAVDAATSGDTVLVAGGKSATAKLPEVPALLTRPIHGSIFSIRVSSTIK